VIEKYNRFAKRVDELGLQGDVDAKPILDVRFLATISHVLFTEYQYCAYPQGREIVRILGAQKPGQWTGNVLAEVIKWQLGHPGETKEQCAEWLKEELAAGRLSMVDEARRQRGGSKETAKKKTRT
jgi:tRNA nucleotidyltransferase (CCA-adding enzyme)